MFSKSKILFVFLLISLLFSCSKEESEPNEPNPIKQTQWFIDLDEDGFGNPDISMGKLSVQKPLGFVENNTDCNDADNTINPNAEEDPYDGIDSDCDNAQETVINSISLNLGGISSDYAVKVTQTTDGDYVTAGSSFSNEVVNFMGDWDFYLVKTDNEGVVKWEKKYGGPDEDSINDMYPTSDGGFILTGASKSTEGNVRINFGDFDWWVVKVDSEGNIVWEITLGGSGYDIPSSIIETKNGNYLVGGVTRSSDEFVSNNYGQLDAWLVKLDSSGGIIWEKNYGGSLGDSFSNILQLDNGDFFIQGATSSTDGDLENRNVEDGSTWILRLDESGNILANKILEGDVIGSTRDIILGLNGDILFTGSYSISSGNIDGVVMSITENGSVNWRKTYGGAFLDYLFSIDVDNEGGYYASGGYSQSGNNNSRDKWLLKLDDSGNVIWENTYGGTDFDQSAAVKSIDEGVITVGQSSSVDRDIISNIGSQDIWFLKLKPNGKL